MITTLNTVSVVLLMKARRMRKFCVVSTVWMLSISTNGLGSVKVSSDASAAVLDAVRKMNANGMRNITIDSRMATMPTTMPRVRSRFMLGPPAG